jgi:hypothetical protein
VIQELIPHIKLGGFKADNTVVVCFMLSPALPGVALGGFQKLVETPSGSTLYSRRMHLMEVHESGYDTPSSRSRRANLREGPCATSRAYSRCYLLFTLPASKSFSHLLILPKGNRPLFPRTRRHSSPSPRRHISWYLGPTKFYQHGIHCIFPSYLLACMEFPSHSTAIGHVGTRSPT